jgi:ABC-type antimicrobial peptide transport system permease subunit
MALMYSAKHVFRNWKLFTALLIGIALAATFFAAINMKANLSASQALDQQLKNVNVDLQFSVNLNKTNLAQAESNVSSINGVKSVDLLARLSNTVSQTSGDNYTTPLYLPIYCFPNSSSIYDEWLNKPVDGIGENETWVLKNSPQTANISVGDTIITGIPFPTPKYDNVTTVYLNLTVAGFVQLTDKGYQLISGNSFSSPFSPVNAKQIYGYQSDLMIISWENTLQKVWDTMPNRTVSTTFSINLDHNKLLSPWNTQASANNVNTIANDISNNILANYEVNGYVMNNLGNALSNFQYNFQSTLMNFIVISLPVFFVAWYLGYTVSDVSFNMRRREIGLLSTKGLSSGQIQRIFLTEALIIGIIGGAAGVVGGLILNQVFTGGINLTNLFNPQLTNPYTMILTVIIGMILSLSSVFFSARKAAKLPTVEALREYMPMETDQPYRKRLPWVAFILGTYKIIIIILGINIPILLSSLTYSGGNYFLSIFFAPLTILDQVLNYIGPMLFFWGITKLLIQNSLKFQQLTSNISRVMGDLGSLAAKNVRRNSARAAAIAFLIALIIGYSVQVTGQMASSQDFGVRQARSSVGADVSVSVLNATKAPDILTDIIGNVSGIRNSTMQCQLVQSYAGTTIETVDPDSWLAAAYYEKEWFTGTSVEQAFNEMKSNNMTIILEQRVAQQLKLKIGDTIGIDFSSGARKLTIIGFFGPAPASPSLGSGAPSFILPTWSYVPRNLFNMSSPYSDAYKLENFDVQILLKLDPGINGTAVAEKIRNLNLEIYGVTSFDEQWRQSQNLNNQNTVYSVQVQGSPHLVAQSQNLVSQNTFYNMQVLDIQELGIIFAVLSATVGMALIAVVSLRERSREATLMSVRGLSYRQIVWMFLNENIAIITFSVILGLSVGLIIDYGSIISTTGVTSQLVVPRFVYPTNAIETIATFVVLIYATTIAVILIMTSQYVTKLEKMVRMK